LGGVTVVTGLASFWVNQGFSRADIYRQIRREEAYVEVLKTSPIPSIIETKESRVEGIALEEEVIKANREYAENFGPPYSAFIFDQATNWISAFLVLSGLFVMCRRRVGALLTMAFSITLVWSVFGNVV